MNPQMNYTPQQVMGHDSYSVPCRVGNWAEDEYMGVVRTPLGLVCTRCGPRSGACPDAG